jgi:hypothetical protein
VRAAGWGASRAAAARADGEGCVRSRGARADDDGRRRDESESERVRKKGLTVGK